MNKQNIVNKYSKKLLGTCDYKKDVNYYVENFLDYRQLIDFLYGLETHEHSLTKSGFSFLKGYYGLEEIARILLEENPDYPYKSKEEIVDWLNVKNEFAIDDQEVLK